MLNTIPKMPELGQASRRAVKAAALTIELAGGVPDTCTMSSGSQPPTCIHHRGWNLLLLPTSCQAPIYIAEAVELVRRLSRESALIVRLDTNLEPSVSFVTFDAVLRLHGEIVVMRGLLPCVIGGDRLAFVHHGASRPALTLGSEGLIAESQRAGEGAWNSKAGIAVAAAFFRSRIWGGL
jgi:hypothetical protein